MCYCYQKSCCFVVGFCCKTVVFLSSCCGCGAGVNKMWWLDSLDMKQLLKYRPSFTSLLLLVFQNNLCVVVVGLALLLRLVVVRVVGRCFSVTWQRSRGFCKRGNCARRRPRQRQQQRNHPKTLFSAGREDSRSIGFFPAPAWPVIEASLNIVWNALVSRCSSWFHPWEEC